MSSQRWKCPRSLRPIATSYASSATSTRISRRSSRPWRRRSGRTTMPDPESGARGQAWRLAPLLFVAANVLFTTVYIFHERSMEARLGLWLSGLVMAQITLLALWTSWGTAAVWKRWAIVVACMGLAIYIALVVEWWVGGALVEGMLRAQGAVAFLLLSLAAILMPVRWLTGCRLSFSR